ETRRRTACRRRADHQGMPDVFDVRPLQGAQVRPLHERSPGDRRAARACDAALGLMSFSRQICFTSEGVLFMDRKSHFVLALALTAGPSTAALADRIVFNNGDQISGKIVSVE